MTTFLDRARRLWGHTRGSTVIEFAVVAPIAMGAVVALGDIGYQGYATATLSGEMQKAARDSTLEGSVSQQAIIDQRVKDAVRKISKDATFVITRNAFMSYSDVGQPEPYNDANMDGDHDAGECFFDEDSDGKWDGKDGTGGPDDVIVYKVVLTYPRIFPMPGLLGWDETVTVESSTTLKNQPYGEQVVPDVEGCA